MRIPKKRAASGSGRAGEERGLTPLRSCGRKPGRRPIVRPRPGAAGRTARPRASARSPSPAVEKHWECSTRGRHYPSIGPPRHGRQGRLEFLTLLGQGVLDTDGRLRQHRARHDRFALQLAESLGEHPIADVPDRAADRREPQGAGHQNLHHGAGPSGAHELDRLVKLRTKRGSGHVPSVPGRAT
jgi:hypothetical protein